MTFNFKKEYKANYIAIRGKGSPNEEGGAYRQAISKYIFLMLERLH